MSGIFGFAGFDGCPISVAQADRMAASAAAWGRDGVDVWRGNGVVLGRSLMRDTPEDAFDRTPVCASGGNVAVTAAARLDNRDELCDRWALPASERNTTSDAALVCRAVCKWGDDAPAHLLGDWSFAAWFARERRLLLARDHLGIDALFYWHGRGVIVFASSLRTLFAAPEIERRVDDEWVARLLVAEPGELDRTFYQGVHQLLPGHQLSVSEGGATRRRYWSAADAAPVRHASERGYLDEFLERYRCAVRSRLRATGPIASALSSGLDSGSVVTLAAEELRRRNQPLTAITAIPRFAPAPGIALANEGPLAAEIAARWENVSHVLVDAAGITPVGSFARALDAYPSPGHSGANLHWGLAMFADARDRGAKVLLDGAIGNLTISWDGGTYRMLHALRRAPLGDGLPALRGAAVRVGWARALRRLVVGPALRPVRAQLAGLGRHSRTRWRRWGVPNPALLDRVVRDGWLEGKFATTTRWPRPAAERLTALELNAAAAGPFYRAMSAAYGLSIRNPTTDVRLVEYCFGIPETLYWIDGDERTLLKRSMRELMPEGILTSTTRGRQSADLRARFLASAAEVDSLLERFDDSDGVRAYVDVAAIRTAWREVQRDDWSDALLTHVKLPRALMTGLAVLNVLDEGVPHG